MSQSVGEARHGLFMLRRVVLLLFFTIVSASAGENYSFNHRKIISGVVSSSLLDKTTYAVIFDAGSSGSRVHVFHFDQNLDLLFIGKDIEVFSKTSPGLSAYGDDPNKAAASLIPLLGVAERAVPQGMHSPTPVRLGATAGLRLLEGDKPEKILEAVRNLLKTKSSFKYDAESVKILEGNEEGSYMWLTINYLLEKLGKTYSDTVGVVDLGGGSVQMAYAISEEAAANAPTPSHGNSKYIESMYLKGTKYNVYVHSYLHYGLLAARVEILKVTNGFGNPCILTGYDGIYTYNGKDYKASAPRSGSSFNRCRRVILKALKIHKPCNYSECSFNGIWNGGGGDGQKNLYVASFFYDRVTQVGFVEPKTPNAVVKAIDFKKAAERACKTKFDEAKSKYPNVYTTDLQYVCMDLVYEYALLVNGFGIHPHREITVLEKVPYRGSLIGAAWPLGNAIAVVSSSKHSIVDYQSS